MTKPTDGLFLSTYLAPPRLSTALGVSPRHDQNLALWRVSGHRAELIRHWELERLSGEKQHSRPFDADQAAKEYIAGLLAAEGVAWTDLSAAWGTPGLDSGDRYCSPIDGLPLHAIAHAYSALYLDSEIVHTGRILCFAPDGGPDHVLGRTLDWYAGAYVDRGVIRWFPAESPGRIYDSARKAFGMREGTLMALAAACPIEIYAKGADLIADLEFRGALPDNILGGAVAAGEVVLARAKTVVDQAFADGPPHVAGFSDAEVRIAAVMQVLQEACEAVMIRNVERFLAKTRVDPSTVHLALAGGYALNCPTNSMLMDRYGFAGLLAPPCANDSGQALGVGLALLHQRDPALEFTLGTAYHGRPVTDLDNAIDEFRAVAAFAPHTNFDAGFVQDVVSGPVAWLSGDAEIGPRALGHRSLLADPRRLESKDLLNQLKERQWWRPVAPLVLEAQAGEWFETSRPSPFMLETAQVRSERRDQIPAIRHLDDSARLQTLHPQDEPLLHQGISAFAEVTGVPMVCNTSLNGPGQPIIQTAQQAFAFCAGRGIPICYVDGQRITIAPSQTVGEPRHDFPAATPWQETEIGSMLTAPELYHVMTTPALHRTDLSDDGDCRRAQDEAATYYKEHPGELAWVETWLRRRTPSPGALG